MRRKRRTTEFYEDMTKADLYERAGELDIEGRSQMNKGELIEAIAEAEAE